LIEAYQAGASADQVAKDFGIGKASVVRLLREAGVIRKQNRPTEAQLAQATHLHIKEGWSLERIGEHLGFRNTTIYRHLKQRGVVMRRPWEHLPPS
jgi:DNA-binding transcriptional regulator LsrR (DeoR family)